MDDNLLCLFTAQVEERDGSFVIDVPPRELDIGEVEAGESYRVAMIPSGTRVPPATESSRQRNGASPPVEKGDEVDVEIENLGDKGDGIARVGPGYVVIVPETNTGERVSVEITEARENVAFADVVERHDRQR